MRKERNKERRNPIPSEQPAGKSRKTNDGEYRETEKLRRKAGKRDHEKDMENEMKGPPRKKMRQTKIGEKTAEKVREREKGRYEEFGEVVRW